MRFAQGFATCAFASLAMAAHAQPSPDQTHCLGGEDISADVQIAACTSVMQSATPTDENYAVAVYNRGVAYYTKGDFEHAIADFGNAITLKPDYACMTLTIRGNAYRREGQFDRAVADYDEAIRLKPDYAAAFNQRGYAYQERGEFHRAITDYDEAIRLSPDMAVAFNNRGMADQGEERLDRAIIDYNEAIKLNPNDLTAMRSRGTVHFSLEHYSEAAADFKEALRLAPSDPYSVLWLHLVRARAPAMETDDFSVGAETLDLAAWPGPVISLFLGRSSPDDVRVRSQQGDVMSVKSQSCEAAFYLGEYAMLRGDMASAKPLLQEAFNTCPKSYAEYLLAPAELKRLP